MGASLGSIEPVFSRHDGFADEVSVLIELPGL